MLSLPDIEAGHPLSQPPGRPQSQLQRGVVSQDKLRAELAAEAAFKTPQSKALARGAEVDEEIPLDREHDAQISMTAQGNPEENGYAERLIRTIKEEEVDL